MITTLYLKRTQDDPEAEVLYHRLRHEGLEGLQAVRIERVFRIEGEIDDPLKRLSPLFVNPVTEVLSPESGLDPSEGPIFEVGYQRAVTDPELDSIRRGAEALGVANVEWARIARRYQFIGLSEKDAEAVVRHYLFNPQVQVLIRPDEPWITLKPQGVGGAVATIPFTGKSLPELRALSEERRLFLDDTQLLALQAIEKENGRPFTDAEIEMFAQTWSDHCFHTTWKALGLLKRLQNATETIAHPLVLSAFEDNAGVMAFYEGWALTVKGETHNSPTAVSPYGGIMTKHGGVIRDTLGCGQGAWPIGGSTVMGLGNPHLDWEAVPEGVLHPRTILVEAIRGTADYTNPMGIPMMFPIYRFHPGYLGKCFALGHSIGLIPANRAKKGKPKPGDFVVLIGGLTGRDGLHGATVSSGQMTNETARVDAAHVQIGHPIEERKFMEAIPVLRERDCLRAITDLGAGGLSSAAGEMGAETGVWINLARVPLKTEGMRPWEIWISESQERMLLCVPPEKIEEALQLLRRYEVPAVTIGRFTEDRRCRVVYARPRQDLLKPLPDPSDEKGEMVVDLAMEDLRQACPLPKIPVASEIQKREETPPPPLPKERERVREAILRVLTHPNICDQSAAGFQFDSTVQGKTAIGPYGGKDGRMPHDVWAATPLAGKPYAAVAACAYVPFYGEVRPDAAARLLILEAMTHLVAVGVDPKEITLCDNFYTPRVNPRVARVLTDMVASCADFSVQLGVPFISGKDSSSGTFVSRHGLRIDVPPTLAVLALGRMPDIQRHVPKAFQSQDSRLYLIGPLSKAMGGSVYWDTLGLRGTTLPDPDLDTVRATWRCLRVWQERGWIRSASALGEGGLIRRLFEMALGGGMGCAIDPKVLLERLGTDYLEVALFAEMIGCVILEAPGDPLVQEVLVSAGAVSIGRTLEDTEIVLELKEGSLTLPMAELVAAWEKPFREVARG